MSTATLAPAAFDEFGRCLPTAVQSPVHRQSRRYFRLGTPAVDPAAILARIKRHLGAGKGLDVDSFIRRIDAIRARLAADPATAGMLNGLAVPFIVPRTPVTEIGTLMEEGYLPAVARSFEEAFPAERFTNHVKPGLAGKLTVQPGSRHERLIEAMGDDEVVGLYFPCLTEYSLPAAVEQIASLPDHLLLAGGFDTAAAFVGVPDLLLRTDGYPPLLWLTGLAGEKPGIGYHFEAYGHDLTFNRRAHLGQTAEYWWSGISVLDTR